MKVLIFSDFHAHNWKQHHTILENGKNSRFQISIDILGQIRTYAVAKGIKHILFGGDMFEVGKRPSIDVFNTVYWKLSSMVQQDGLCLWLLPGNHDHYNKSGSIHSMSTFASFATIMDKFSWYIDPESGLGIQAFPYTEDADLIRSGFDAPVDETIKFPIRLMHCGIEGAKLGTHEYQMKEEFSASEIQAKNPMMTFVGHYHTPQDMGNGVVYIGSPNPTRFSDPPVKDRGFIVADLEAGTFERISVDAPQFITIGMDQIDAYKDLLKGSFLRVEIDKNLTTNEIHQLDDMVKSLGVADRKFQYTYKEEEEEDEDRLAVTPEMGHAGMIDAYAEKYAPEHLNKDLLKAMGKNILLQVQKRKTA